jgi:hypothetical protein
MFASRIRLFVCLLLASVTPVGAQLVGMSGYTSTTGQVSPSVVATYIGERVDPGMERLRLLVLWRDEPGWFTGGGSASGGGGSAPGTYRTAARLGNFEFAAAIEGTRALVLGQTFDLDRSNVILVDDAAGQRKIVGTLGLQAQLTTPPGNVTLDRLVNVFALEDIRRFLRCDRQTIGLVRVTSTVCASLVGR